MHYNQQNQTSPLLTHFHKSDKKHNNLTTTTHLPTSNTWIIITNCRCEEAGAIKQKISFLSFYLRGKEKRSAFATEKATTTSFFYQFKSKLQNNHFNIIQQW